VAAAAVAAVAVAAQDEISDENLYLLLENMYCMALIAAVVLLAAAMV